MSSYEIPKYQKYDFFMRKDDKSGVWCSNNGFPVGTEWSTLQLDFKTIMYFEVTLVKCGGDTADLSLGFAPVQPNWITPGRCGEKDCSVGYHGSGKVLDDGPSTFSTLPTFGAGDTVGAFWNTTTQEVWFTKNGKKLYEEGRNWMGFRGLCQQLLLPTITIPIGSAEEYTVNYGETKYMFDVSEELGESMAGAMQDLEIIHGEIASEYTDQLYKELISDKGSPTADVTILLKDNQKVSAHSLILASRSKGLSNLLLLEQQKQQQQQLEKKNNNKLVIDLTVESLDIFKVVLEYLYCGRTTLTDKTWKTILKSADKLGIASLRKACSEFMVQSLDTNSAVNMMKRIQLGEFDFNTSDLLARCVTLLEKRAYEIIKTESFFSLDEDAIILMLKNNNTCVDEFEMAQACVKWAQHKIKTTTGITDYNSKDEQPTTNQIREKLRNIAPWIRYPLLGPRELVKKLKPYGFIPPQLYREALEYIANPDSVPKKERNEKLQYQKRYQTFALSTIIDEKLSQQLLNWLPPSKKGWDLIYKAKKDGFQASTFHAKCDQKGETVVVIKSSNGNIFGGYAPLSWGITSTYTNDPKTFLFSLVNKSGKPTKIDNQGTNSNSQYNAQGYGPTFGGGHDLYISDSSNLNSSSYSNLGYSFRFVGGACGSQQAKTFLAGAYNFQVDDIEVFAKIQ